MIFSGTGRVVDDFYVLGAPATPCYLFDCRRPFLFDAGQACLSPAYAQAIRSVLGERKPAYLFLTHSHFDHCGSAAFLQREFPGLQVGASSKAAQVFTRPRALELIRRLSEEARLGYCTGLGVELTDEPFRPPQVDLEVNGGERLELDEGLTLEVIATPGHTWDFLSYYIPQRRILVASEAVGCIHLSGNMVIDFLVDYDAYYESLKRLSQLEVEVLCQGHHYVYTGDEVKEHMDRSLRETVAFREMVLDFLEKNKGDVAQVMEMIQVREYEPMSEPKQPLPAYLLNLESRVRHLAQAAGWKDNC